MRIQKILIIFIIALLALLTLQGIWLYNTYQIKLKETNSLLNSILVDAVEQEKNSRIIRKRKNEETRQMTSIDTIYVKEINKEYLMEKGIAPHQFDYMQFVLSNDSTLHFNLHSLDSIYSFMLHEKNISIKYALIYEDSQKIVETIGDTINNSFKTSAIHILNNSIVYAIIDIPFPTVLKSMIGVLLISIFIVFILTAILIYELRVIFTQNHLAQLHANFINTLTHDMKTPLGTIYMVIDQLNKGTLNNNERLRNKFCQTAIEQILNIQTLVDKILTIAYVKHKQLVLNKVIIDLPQVIQSLIDKFMIMNSKSVTFTTDYDLEDINIYADEFYLSNAISNLIDNAIKYSGDTVQITISCAVDMKYIYIKIKDNGFGISLADQQKVFEQFERGAATQKNMTKGFGLGLNYVKSVAIAHEGSINLSSFEGEGSEFVLTIPIK
ncbi:MAG: HAMP domain-containing histidine kinase [Prevotellaceae bacterium]|jgi:two-component system phosphate regulon sensor histidine kinase PhoR|nr:HAMP domain-containing histidine kinase [Prevotellaceae bacterium]